jgi:hypothetical protein
MTYSRKPKPYRGEIHNWEKRRFDKDRNCLPENLGYVIFGRPKGHPSFSRSIQTSAVVSHNEETGEIETLNSIYQLIGEGREGRMV